MDSKQKDRILSFQLLKSDISELFKAAGSDNDKVIITEKTSGEKINVAAWYENLTRRIMERFDIYEQSIKNGG